MSRRSPLQVQHHHHHHHHHHLATGHDTLEGTPYEKLLPGKPPIPITVAPRPSSARLEFHPSLRQSTASPEPSPALNGSSASTPPHARARSHLHHDPRRDSAIAVSDPTARNSRATFTTDQSSTRSIKKSHSLPRMNSNGGSTAAAALSPNSRKIRVVSSNSEFTRSSHDAPQLPVAPLLPLSSDVANISFDDLTSPEKIQFSNRGSMLIGGKRANEIREQNSKPTIRQTKSVVASVPIRLLSPEEEATSRRVRSMYENGTIEEHLAVHDSPITPVDTHLDHAIEEEPVGFEAPESPPPNQFLSIPGTGSLSAHRTSTSSLTRQEHELAGGIEDWQDVKGDDVDRYGFISLKPVRENNASSLSLPSSPSPGLHRVSTVLQLASEAPRRSGAGLIRTSSQSKKSTRSHRDLRSMNRDSVRRPLSSQSSYRSTASGSSRLRTATNRLPHNRGRRIVDEAGDMLTLPPGLADIAEQEDAGRTVDMARHKEWEREAKWRKMARIVKRDGGKGGGMTFEFDTRDPKLIERTWKGIPDRWRASAWYSFLATSARRTAGSPTDAELRAAFDDLLEQGSPDDGQIDTDVPRTIGSHIMFRARYRGGQRLLFRVLHCLSLYFPQTGYVQGMAALAATFLCYFDEQTAFVMLVRMWQLRGLERLYRSGFEGLMRALGEFDRRWLSGKPVGAKLTELGISADAYGTRWYLTAFNYSIPFSSQLRVWDVFLLLGEPDRPLKLPPRQPAPANPHTSVTESDATVKEGDVGQQEDSRFDGSFDVLHATAAALIDAMREILLDSDFENAMKVLTSWVPVRDEDLLMRVAKEEYRHLRRRR